MTLVPGVATDDFQPKPKGQSNMELHPVLIGGERVETGETVAIENPYTRTAFAQVPLCGPREVDRACKAALAGLKRNDFPQHQRARVLETAADLLRGRIDDFARSIMRESGKPLKTARVEATRCVDTLTFAAVEARTLSGELLPMEGSQSGAGKLAFAMRVPIGVVAAITPFNFPLNLVAHKLAPAIAAGCPVVLKPAPQTPLSGMMLVDLLIEAGLPADWISVVTDSGAEAAAPLVEHDIPAMVTFTGSAPVGWSIAAKAPKKRVSLELGSNSPVIVEPDTNIDAIAGKIRVAGFSHAGQSCISVQRVLVNREIHEPFVAALRAGVESLVCGDPADEATDLGPLIRERDTTRVLEWIDEAVKSGARLVTGGTVDNGILAPTVLDNPPRAAKVCSMEVFGPVVAVVPYDSFDEAIAIANDSDFGLHAGVFTNDIGKALKAARELDFGGVLINEVPTFRADQQPYGGVRDAGNTREGPRYTVHEMTELRMVSFQQG
jgi:acyl-CoA reductase-like NAD-dependent aldehyde dehydrogenase